MKEETKLKKQQFKNEIRDKYKHYFDLLVNCGGALNLKDFSMLLKLDYTKTTRELKYIEENTNIIKSYIRDDLSINGTPRRSKTICLTRAGWKYLTNKTRNEVKFENEATMDNIRLKAYEYSYLNNYRNKTNTFKDTIIKMYGNAYEDMKGCLLFDGESMIDIDEFFNKTKFILTNFEHVGNYEYQINACYIRNRLSSEKFLEEMDQLLSILEFLYDKRKTDKNNSVKFNINVKCILRHKPDIGLFIHLKNKYQRKYHFYFTTDMDVSFKQRRSFKTLFKEVYKRVEFLGLEDDYTLTEL